MDTTSKTSERYWAFISYRHADNKVQDREWASWLHREIEQYEVPAELIGTKNGRGITIPERIYPIFRDEESLPADSSLADSIEKALDMSQFLVVLCSPQAVESRYVAQEIEHFKTSERSNYIIAGIISGEPGDADKECFPEPMRNLTSAKGKLIEPIAADFRLADGSEGFTSSEAYRRELLNQKLEPKQAKHKTESYDERLQLMKLKIIAGILGVPLEVLRNRDKAYQLTRARKRQRALTAIATSLSVLVIVAIIAGFLAMQQKKIADVQRDKAKTNEELAKEQTKIAIQQTNEAETQKNLATQNEKSAIESEKQAKHSLAEADYRLATSHFLQKNHRLAFCHLTRALENNPEHSDAAQLAWSTICRGNLSFRSKKIPVNLTPWSCSFSYDGKSLLWVDNKGIQYKTTLSDQQTVKVGRITDWQPAHSESYSNTYSKTNQTHQMVEPWADHFLEYSIDSNDKVNSVKKKNSYRTETLNSRFKLAKLDSDDAQEFESLHKIATPTLRKSLQKAFENAEYISDLIVRNRVANDEEIISLITSKGNVFNNLSGLPILSYHYLKEHNLVIIKREGGHSNIHTLEAIWLEESMLRREMLAAAPIDCKLNIYVSSDGNHIAIQERAQVHLMSVKDLSKVPYAHYDAEQTSLQYSLNDFSVASLVCDEDIHAVQVHKNSVVILSNNALHTYPIFPDFFTKGKIEQPSTRWNIKTEENKVFLVKTNILTNTAKDILLPLKVNEKDPTLIFETHEIIYAWNKTQGYTIEKSGNHIIKSMKKAKVGELNKQFPLPIDQYSVNLVLHKKLLPSKVIEILELHNINRDFQSRACKLIQRGKPSIHYCNIVRNDDAEAGSRLIILSNDASTLLDKGYLGETSTLSDDASLALTQYGEHYTAWCPSPTNTHPPIWLHKFLTHYSGVKFDEQGKMIHVDSMIKVQGDISSMPQTWESLATQLSFNYSKN